MEQQGPRMEQRGWSTTERRCSSPEGMEQHRAGKEHQGTGMEWVWSSDKKSNTQRGWRGMERMCRMNTTGARVQVHRAGATAGTREREQQRSGMEQQGAATSTNTVRGRNQVQLLVGCRCTERGRNHVQLPIRCRCRERSTCREQERQLQGLRSGAGAGAGSESGAGTQVASERQERSRVAMEKHTMGLGWRKQQTEEMTEEAKGWSEG
jgi:hypothetical protein